MLNKLKVNGRLVLLIGLSITVSVVLSIIGLSGLSASKASLQTVFDDRMVPVGDLYKISHSLKTIEAEAYEASSDVSVVTSLDKKPILVMKSEVADSNASHIDKEVEQINTLWQKYMATYLTPEEKILADKFGITKEKYLNNGAKPLLNSLRAHKIEDVNSDLTKVKNIYVDANNDLDALIKLQFDVANQEYQSGIKRYENSLFFSLLALGLSIVALGWLGWLISRSITRPLQKAISVFDEIAAGNFDSAITLEGNNELSKVLSELDGMQGKLKQDIKNQQEQSAIFENQLAAISNSTGVIEFTLDGKVTAVNTIFLNIMGYTLNEAVGQHHSTFVDPAFRSTAEYRMFWEKLGRGEFDAGQYKRIAKGGREVWLQASYNPIMDVNGVPFKVVKYATDITDQINAQQILANAVQQTQEVVSAAKAGDLTERIPLEGKTGSIQELCDGVNSLVENMAEIITQIKESGETINTAANEISAGNNDLSQRTEEQASSLEETASSMEELASTVKQNAENARQANQLAAAASGVAVKGGEVVGEVVHTMSDINDSSRKIVDIISVIDGIAFQTNILALNAAVEAARAGEQGRGFAVVAGEVRNLAQRSAAAAKEIKQLISDSVEKVQGGTKLVEEAGKTMEEIVSSVKRVTDIMGEIAAASAEQSDGIDQVNGAITQMDEVTQQNAALVEEAAAAAESLVEQANTLMDAVSVFRVGNDSGSHIKRITHSTSSRAIAVNSTKVTQSKPVSHTVKKNANEDEWEEF